MARNLLFLSAAILFCVANSRPSSADEKQPVEKSAVKMTAQELADWIDKRFEEEYQKAGTKPGDVVDDATFLRRVYLDLQGRIPTVAQLRDFMAEESSFKRQDYVDRLLTSEKRPEQFSKRSADHLARVWRRMMVPAASPGVG